MRNGELSRASARKPLPFLLRDGTSMSVEKCYRESAITEVTSGILFSIAAYNVWSLLWPGEDTSRFLTSYLQNYLREESLMMQLSLLEWGFRISSLSVTLFLIRFYFSFAVFDVDNIYCTNYLKGWSRFGRVIEWTLRCIIVSWVILGVQSDLDIVGSFQESFQASPMRDMIPSPDGFPEVEEPNGVFVKAFIFMAVIFVLMWVWVAVMAFRSRNRSRTFANRFIGSPFFGISLSVLGIKFFSAPNVIGEYIGIVGLFFVLAFLFAAVETIQFWKLARLHAKFLLKRVARGAYGANCHCHGTS